MSSLVLLGCATAKVAENSGADSAADADAGTQAAAAPEKPKRSPEELAREVEQMFARERESAGSVSMTLDGKTVELEASAPVEIARNEELRQSSLAVSIGTAEKLQCFVYDAMVPVGTLLGLLTEGLRGKVDIKSVRTSAIEVIEKEPAVFAEIAYVAPTQQGNVIGQLKLGLYPSPTAALACLHDEPGYVQTFKRVVTRLATGLARARATADSASYRVVYVTSIRGAPVGFERTVYVKAKDGTRTGTTISALVVPRAASEWMLQDSFYVSQIGKDGYLTAKTARIASNGEEQVDVTLKRDKAGYAYSGRAAQKELSGTFKTKDKKGLATDVVVVKSVKALLMTGKKPELQFEQYLPEADPTAPLVVTMKRDAAGPDAVMLETAKVKMSGRVDAAGDLVSVEVPMGPVTLVQERKFVEGSPE